MDALIEQGRINKLSRPGAFDYTQVYGTSLRAERIIRGDLQSLSPQELIEWLSTPSNSRRPDLYQNISPEGLEFVSMPDFSNCAEYARSILGMARLNLSKLIPSSAEGGKLIVYYLDGLTLPTHYGVIIEGGARVISQWGQGGSVFKHALMQIPTIYGSRYQCYEA